MTTKETEHLTYTVMSENRKRQTVAFKINHHSGMYLIHRALLHQITDKRIRYANTKNRSQVQGGGSKPWKQKGTGRARAGSSRSPLWKGGGIIFGPTPKEYNCKINRKEKQLALRTLLHNKFNNTYIVPNVVCQTDTPNTKLIAKRIKNLGLDITNNILIIIDQKNKPFFLSIRNLPKVRLTLANQINILSLLQADKLIITEDALETINKIYNEQ